ncbi:tRNA (adenosine(37)-N6)-threonylcarbamoyltransferase complex dimerization subunit type 1 TsaB [Aliidiomarina shirensis]|uniref:tRNA threonylcarbamoyladenosine biosynthesis protein TsaB n=1 Tax=Aliidiomarina shirensis TaxID=1048642 RepID=A0A432WTX5_9GAMM|nr:tRNA (adenosine(37)-N6)-threonylcarbamoyltransferase complex dimerization subunit type 1 TsaB [Aliidiomarina shirensis]RUO37226.1 tRNA (adenosine(37)-N6)-threonylcarbamoyltransferase complex dimerization subunit type 1 TsaB [Aliidiomarina shirensis]
MNSSRLLAIDSATEYCSVAYTDGQQLITRGQEAPRKHADLILPYVQDVLAEAKITLADLDAIVVGRGPGSFTGVRIAAGIAQGLAFSQDIPLIGVSSLEAMAQQALRLHGAKAVVAAIDARMGEVYFGTCLAEHGLMVMQGKEIVCAPDTVKALAAEYEWFTVGTGFVTYPEVLAARFGTEARVTPTDIRFPHAEDMLPIATQRLINGKAVAAEDFDVHYVRNEVTWQKLPGRS